MAILVSDILISKEMITDDNNVITGVKVTMSSGEGIFMVSDAEGNIDNDWVRTTDYVAEKTYTANGTNVLVVNKGTSSNALTTENVTITIDEIGIEKESIFGYCGSKCKHEIYTKEEIDKMIELKGTTIYFGTGTPSDFLGNDGDIYLKYE